MSEQSEPKIENGTIQWKTENGVVNLSTNGKDWIEYKNNKAEVVKKIKEQLGLAKETEEQKPEEPEEPEEPNSGGKKSKKRRNKNKKRTCKNKQ